MLGPVLAVEAVCEVYMSDTQAAGSIFPGAKLEKKSAKLTADEVSAVEKGSGEAVRSKEVTYFSAPGGKTVYIDKVLGKHEFITFAVGVDAGGKVAGIEILEYRESYGHEIRRPEWRGQFKGKDISAHLQLDDDIKNISGATLSSAHITRGVKRVLHTHAQLHKRGEAGPAHAGNGGPLTPGRRA
jgi:Na+-translocating ferredoxin:NAD+ oxidoreductase RnfG subunit